MTTRTLYILRGLPSAGKTTLAEQLAPAFNCSLEEFLAVCDGAGVDVVANYGDALHYQKAIVETWMREGCTPIAIDNVNATKNQVFEWTLLAITHGYRWVVLHVETDLPDVDLAARSATDCPAERIAYFRERFQPWGS